MSATEVFFRDFFPTAHIRLSKRWPALWRQLQPAWLEQACPEQQIELPLPQQALALGGSNNLTEGNGTLLLRNPGLLPFQLAGLAVAFFGLRRLAGSPRRLLFLRLSLLFFALMNASSILCHTLAARDSPLWHAALHADVAFTGTSSLCLLASQVLPGPASAASAAAAAWTTFLLLLAAVIGNSHGPHVPWMPEAIYLGTTALAAAAAGSRLLRCWAALPTPQRAALLPRLVLAALGVGAMGLCLPLDPLLCAVAGPHMGTVPLLFAGSDLGFAALVLLSSSGGGAVARRAHAD